MNLYIAYTPDSFSSFIPNGIWLKFQPIITEVINKEKPNKKYTKCKKIARVLPRSSTTPCCYRFHESQTDSYCTRNSFCCHHNHLDKYMVGLKLLGTSLLLQQQ